MPGRAKNDDTVSDYDTFLNSGRARLHCNSVYFEMLKSTMDFDLSKVSNHQTYNLLVGLVAPRPIAWITSQDLEGRLNAAPFSAYNYVCTDPPVVAIGVANRPAKEIIGKDTAQIFATPTNS